jgi:DNA-nicking Smr family endonuclease
MGKKKKTQVRNERFSAKQYFEDDDKYLPFKDVKLKPAKEKPVMTKPSQIKPVSSKVYDMYTPGATNVVQKIEQMPLGLLRECSPQRSCDLHGKRPGRDDIAALVNEFLDECVFKGLKKVEIVVGKGNHSDGEPIVPGIVEAALKASAVVSEYSTAPAAKGGSGSFWIILGKRSPKPINVYATTKVEGKDIKGLDKVRVSGQKPAKIDYDAYLPDADDLIDKYRK